MSKQREISNKKQESSSISYIAYYNEHISDLEKDAFNYSEQLQLILHLLSLGQALCKQPRHIIQNLCEEVTKATQHRANLIIYKRKKDHQNEIPDSLFRFPVRFGDLTYGILLIDPDPLKPDYPALSFTISLLLAQICGVLLYIAEQGAILQLNDENFGKGRNVALTKREREILILICRGYNAEKVASQLCISPKTVKRHKHNIYTKLAVHSEHEALIAAYFAHLFLPIEDL